MNDIKKFMDLRVWQEGHKLVLDIYQQIKKFPKEELFELTSQMKRSAVSITSNIAEGFGRRSYKEKIQFYTISSASIAELQNQLLIARDVSYIGSKEFDILYEQTLVVHKMLTGLIKKSKTFF